MDRFGVPSVLTQHPRFLRAIVNSTAPRGLSSRRKLGLVVLLLNRKHLLLLDVDRLTLVFEFVCATAFVCAICIKLRLSVNPFSLVVTYSCAQ